MLCIYSIILILGFACVLCALCTRMQKLANQIRLSLKLDRGNTIYKKKNSTDVPFYSSDMLIQLLHFNTKYIYFHVLFIDIMKR